MSTNDPITGVLVINKPAGVTSHDVITAVRKLLVGLPTEALPPGRAKVGHAGTLDPAATGVLVVAVGGATRLLQYATPWRKTYEADITLGASSTTDDREGTITPQPVSNPPSAEQVHTAAARLTGTITQTPPIYAALKSGGTPLYRLARGGREAEARAAAGEKARPVTIYEFSILTYAYPTLTARITCSSGTYIRSLARDLGELLGTGAYLSALDRTHVGPFDKSKAIVLSEELALNHSALLPAATLVEHLPRITLDSNSVAQCRQGRAVLVAEQVTGDVAALFDSTGTLVGVAAASPAAEGTGTRLQPRTVIGNL